MADERGWDEGERRCTAEPSGRCNCILILYFYPSLWTNSPLSLSLPFTSPLTLQHPSIRWCILVSLSRSLSLSLAFARIFLFSAFLSLSLFLLQFFPPWSMTFARERTAAGRAVCLHRFRTFNRIDFSSRTSFWVFVPF